ncbi:uncharacterized protein RCO7_03430 [Rhynchosporium graminicola]|uniref:Uncharacterized protein n=1 Tax=Rhynchosporium graminicola TaxID=2792576 RepID=A0A1E1LE61_9HELO|nr:uncharacterized protein RCO7_03430 [Rhynchosporium commune]
MSDTDSTRIKRDYSSDSSLSIDDASPPRRKKVKRQSTENSYTPDSDDTSTAEKGTSASTPATKGLLAILEPSQKDDVSDTPISDQEAGIGSTSLPSIPATKGLYEPPCQGPKPKDLVTPTAKTTSIPEDTKPPSATGSLYAPPWSGPKPKDSDTTTTKKLSVPGNIALQSRPAAKNRFTLPLPYDKDKVVGQSSGISIPTTQSPSTPHTKAKRPSAALSRRIEAAHQKTQPSTCENPLYAVRRLSSYMSTPRLHRYNTLATYDNLNDANFYVARLWTALHGSGGDWVYSKGKEADGRIWWAVLEGSGSLVKIDIGKVTAWLIPDMRISKLGEGEELTDVKEWGNDINNDADLAKRAEELSTPLNC